jgi:hypothetical protein
MVIAVSAKACGIIATIAIMVRASGTYSLEFTWYIIHDHIKIWNFLFFQVLSCTDIKDFAGLENNQKFLRPVQQSTYLKFFVWDLQTLDLQVQEELQRHSPCISQSHRLSVPDVASHPHDASVMFSLLLEMI